MTYACHLAKQHQGARPDKVPGIRPTPSSPVDNNEALSPIEPAAWPIPAQPWNSHPLFASKCITSIAPLKE
jgi:hypothetical protein